MGARALDPVAGLDEEPVTIGPHRRIVDLLQQPDADRPESRGDVPATKAQHAPGVAVRPPRQRPPVPGPIGHVAALDIARADGVVGPAIEFAEQFGHALRLVRQVGIHLHHDVVVVLDGPVEPRLVGGPQTGLPGPTEHMDPAQLPACGFGDVGGAVGAVVVDHEHLGRRRHPTDALDDLGDVVGLVVGGHDHDRAHRPGSVPLGGCEAGTRFYPDGRGTALRPVAR